MKYSDKILSKIKSEGYVSPKVKKVKFKNKGYGLVAKKNISKGEIVSISGGIILTNSQAGRLFTKDQDYFYNIEENFVIAPLDPENPTDDWRMNHCCEPNCGVLGQIVFVALKDISIGEELTFDYAMTETDPEYTLNLQCHKKECRGCFTGEDWKLPKIQKKYKGYFSLYVQRKIDEIKRKS